MEVGVFAFLAFVCGVIAFSMYPRKEVVDLSDSFIRPEPFNPVVDTVKKKTNRERLYEVAYSCLGKDMSPQQNELGCAESTYFVMKIAGVPNLPPTPIYSTIVFRKWLEKNLKEVDTPEFGDVVVNETQGTNIGHMGIWGKHNVMSNNSKTYLWDDYYSRDKWTAYFEGTKRLKTRSFRWV